MKKSIKIIIVTVLFAVLSVFIASMNKVSCKAEKAVNEAYNVPQTEYNKPEASAADMIDFYRNLADEISVIEICDSADLTIEDLQNRNGKLIIEKCIGRVENADKDGRVLNYTDPDYYYISYRSVEDCKEGDIVLTYFIYNPDTNYEDDILERFDYVIDSNQ